MEKNSHSTIKDIVVFAFKSIQYMPLRDLKKINLFIGSPNVGKTTLFEAMSLFGLPDLMNELSNFSPSDLIRFNNESELFHNGVITNPNDIEITFDDQTKIASSLTYSFSHDRTCWLRISEDSTQKSVQMRMSRTSSLPGKMEIPIKRYVFRDQKTEVEPNSNPISLQSPFGSNLFQIIQESEELRLFVKDLVDKFQLKILINPTDNSIQFIKPSSIGDYFVMPYSSLADTLQRLIFYKAAICSNKNQVLLFEEPEAHAFPPYMSFFTQEVIADNSNQFFISTHSPYVINDFIENVPNPDDLSIHILHMIEGETKAIRLSQDQVKEINQFGIDLLLNLENYT